MTFLRIAVLAVLLNAFAFTQDFRATILGQVTDPSGAAVPSATVKATRVDTNLTVETKTNANGFYTISFLNPGIYTVEVSAAGFMTLKREDITLATADKLNLPLKLQIG